MNETALKLLKNVATNRRITWVHDNVMESKKLVKKGLIYFFHDESAHAGWFKVTEKGKEYLAAEKLTGEIK